MKFTSELYTFLETLSQTDEHTYTMFMEWAETNSDMMLQHLGVEREYTMADFTALSTLGHFDEPVEMVDDMSHLTDSQLYDLEGEIVSDIEELRIPSYTEIFNGIDEM
jgi:hypothetical protein